MLVGWSMLVSIEGNIGAGKSSLIEAFRNDARFASCFDFQPEPVDTWMTTGFFELFHRDPARWAFTFQSHALLTRVTMHDMTMCDTITERSVLSDRFFKHALLERGELTPAEAHLMDQWFETIAAPALPNVVVYLCVDPATCLERAQRRCRPFELQRIDLDYLETLHRAHETCMSQLRLPVIRVTDNGSDAIDRIWSVLSSHM